MKINSEWKDTTKDNMLKLKILLNPTSHSQIKNSFLYKTVIRTEDGRPKTII